MPFPPPVSTAEKLRRAATHQAVSRWRKERVCRLRAGFVYKYGTEAPQRVVPKPIEGRGIAGELVKRLIADAREQDFLIDPQCYYVDAQFKRHSDWRDLRA